MSRDLDVGGLLLPNLRKSIRVSTSDSLDALTSESETISPHACQQRGFAQKVDPVKRGPRLTGTAGALARNAHEVRTLPWSISSSVSVLRTLWREGATRSRHLLASFSVADSVHSIFALLVSAFTVPSSAYALQNSRLAILTSRAAEATARHEIPAAHTKCIAMKIAP
jgi:hypothetical protein